MRTKLTPPVRCGADNNRYNGGLCRRKDGRWVIHCRDHTLMIYSRAVMAAEIKRLLRVDEIVHHINGEVNDDRPENLQIVTRAEHINMHRADLDRPKPPRTHCIHGHEFTPENTYRAPGTGWRQCRACIQRRAEDKRARLSS